jgi:hypothetical protein
LGFLVVITSVMEFPFRYYFMTSLHTENLTGSAGVEQDVIHRTLVLQPQRGCGAADAM